MSNESESTPAVKARTLRWAQVDVFAESALQGNMLAIFPDATGLTDSEMQALARETNLSETTFILPRPLAVQQQEGVRVRIFTTQEELPFAGHPTLGTASWLKLRHPAWRHANSIVLQLNAGKVPVTFADRDVQPGVLAEMTQPNPSFGDWIEPQPLVDALGLRPEELHASLPAQVVSTGLPFLVVPVATVLALRRLTVNFAKLQPVLDRVQAKFVYCLAQHDAVTWEARMPFYGFEDPATGSAAGCAISYLVARNVASPGQQLRILQGAQVNRPSVIFARAASCDGSVTEVRIAGRTIPVASGRFLLR